MGSRLSRSIRDAVPPEPGFARREAHNDEAA